MQVKIEGTPVSRPIVAAKAKQFFNILGLERTFDTLSGWLTRFKQYHDMREIEIHGHKLSSDQQAPEDFKIKFEQFL